MKEKRANGKILWFFLLGMLLTLCLKAQEDLTPPPPSDGPYPFIEQNPQFPGGEGALIKFLQDNIIYPSSESKNRIEGKVVVIFIVDTDGLVKEPTVSKSISPALDSEALRVISMIPRFNPGHQNGVPIKAHYIMPIKFYLTDKYLDLLSDVYEKYYKNYWAVEAAGQYRAANYEAAIPPFIKLADETRDGMVYAMLAQCYKKAGQYQNRCKALNSALEHDYKGAEAELKSDCK